MSQYDISDLPIRYSGHPRYNSRRVIEDRKLDIILQKLELLLYTNKGDVIDDYEFGCNLSYYIWGTSIPIETIKQKVVEQIVKYIPELLDLGYNLDCYIYDGTYRDILMLDFKINGSDVEFIFK